MNNECDCSKSHVALVDKRCVCESSLCGDAGASVGSKPFTNRAEFEEDPCSEVEEVRFFECEDIMPGSSTKQGGWCRGGEEEVCLLALRISFSVWVFWSRSLRRSLSVCREEVVVVRRLSLVSRSRTWRSLRSRKARWLGRGSVLGLIIGEAVETWEAYAARFCAFRRDWAGVKGSLSTLFERLSWVGRPSVSKSRAMLFSKESLWRSERDWAEGEAELELFDSLGPLAFVPVDASKLYSKADGTYPLASNDVSMLYIVPRSVHVLPSDCCAPGGSSAYLHGNIAVADSISKYVRIVAKAQVSKRVRCRREVVVIVQSLHSGRCGCLGSRMRELTTITPNSQLCVSWLDS